MIRHPSPVDLSSGRGPAPTPGAHTRTPVFQPLTSAADNPHQEKPQLQNNHLRIGKKPNPKPTTSAGRGKLFVTMTTYAEREKRRHAWCMAHPVETDPAVEWIIDMPEGIVEGTQAPDKEKRVQPWVLVGIVALAPVWLPLWGVYLIHEEWNRRRARGTCLTYDPVMQRLKAKG